MRKAEIGGISMLERKGEEDPGGNDALRLTDFVWENEMRSKHRFFHRVII
jgi:hypothetical protein